MLRCTLTILTLATMLVHSLFGCCWHHAHAPEAPATANVQQKSAHTHCHGRPGNARRDVEDASTISSEGNSEFPDDHQGRPCDEEVCTFVGSSSVKVKTPSQFPSGGSLCLPCLTLPAAEARQTLSAGTNRALSTRAPSVRICQLTQVWLL